MMANEPTEHFYGQDETDELLTIAEATPQDDGTANLEVVQIEKLSAGYDESDT